MTAQWISSLICEYPIHCLRAPQIASRHLTSALKAKQPCSWKKIHLFRAVLWVALHWITVTMHQGWRGNHKERAHCLAHTKLRFLPCTMPLCLRKKGGKKKHLAMAVLPQDATNESFHLCSLQQSDSWDGLGMNQPPFLLPGSWSETSYQPSYMWMHECRPQRAPIPDPRATRGRHALKQEEDEIKRTNQIAVPGD